MEVKQDPERQKYEMIFLSKHLNEDEVDLDCTSSNHKSAKTTTLNKMCSITIIQIYP